MTLKELNSVVSKITDSTTYDKIKVFGSALFFDDPNDIDIAVYDLKVGFKVSDKAKQEKIKVHIVPMKKEYWNILKDITSFNNTAAEYYKGEIFYGDNYTASKELSPNNNSIPVFGNFAVVLKTRSKLLKRGFFEID